ncbi:MAG: PKD domain-containing protein, partial [Anaerolineales bacterium]|nr:PKD domain-containing protein [Anaerolineales bacterium]
VTITYITSMPLANFTVAISGTTAVFNNTSLGPNLNFTWDFGDSSGVVTTTHPTHEYAAPGIYTVTLTATNEAGSDTTTQTITINNEGETPFQIFLPVALKEM